METTDRLPIMVGQKLLKQRLDFPFDKRIETTDRYLRMHAQKIFVTTV